MPLIILFSALIILFALYLFSISPNKGRKESMKPFEDVYIAHRGLFDNFAGVPENSLPAFEKAVKEGYGIELDVQLTKDEKLVVFHDEDLSRMCGVNGNLRDYTFAELQGFPLKNSKETIPLFSDALKIIDGKSPLIVEVKPEGNWKKTCLLLAEYLDGCKGPYCVESFRPSAVGWFKNNRPQVIRGQLSTNCFKDTIGSCFIDKFLLTNLMLNFISKPDFIAYNHLYCEQPSLRLCIKLFSPEMTAWTIKDQQSLEKAKHTFQIIIFDSFIPK